MTARHPEFRPTLVLAAALAAALAACDRPDDAAVAPSDYARTAPRPTLLPDAEFAAVVTTATPAVTRIDAEAAALASRAEALQARAEGLQTPVLTPPERARLEAAPAAPPIQ